MIQDKQLFTNQFIKIRIKFFKDESTKLRKGMNSYKWSLTKYQEPFYL
jgi:hypothetical protein